MDKELVGKRVRRHRESLSLTRDQFAERIEISPQFLAEIENGKKGMSAETLYKICKNTNASADYLLLGQQSQGETAIPIPPQYSGIVDDILQALQQIIKKAENNEGEGEK
ncbi:MAG: helix-turn-helix domain-containing protein [Deferribacteraceae bacterium]|jgi:transcriptional regulator with XRE-family HTH domain|nr:helix-turn-helix domain-containing protein [Deferribacteraceae bacterium]